jgi:hypothetical protein
VATWKLAGGSVTIDPLERVTKRDAAALESDAEQVLAFMTPR